MPKRQAFTTAALAALATAAGVGAAHAQTPPAPTHTTSWTGTVGEDRFGDARFKMRGRFQYDLYSQDWDIGAEDQTRSYVRRAFLGVQGRLTEHWRYKVDFVLAPGDDAAGQVGVDDAFLEYVSDNWSIVIGEANITSPLEDRISSLDTPFVERSSIINAYEYGRRAGIGFIAGGANWSASAAAQGDSLNNADNLSGGANGDESTALSGRFTFAPIFETTPEGTTLVHLGVHGRLRERADDGAFQYRTRPLNGRGDRLIASTALGDQDTGLGAEVSAQFGPFGAQAEYILLDGESTGGVDFESDGYYVDLYWSITGESRAYRGNQGGDDYNWFDPWDGKPSPYDDNGHGTHTLGTIVGQNGIGIAPEVTWFACANLDRNLANPALYLDCMQFMLAPFPQDGDPLSDGDPSLAADVLNNSWGCPELEGCDPNALLAAANHLRDAGIFVMKRHPQWSASLKGTLRKWLTSSTQEPDPATYELVSAFLDDPSLAEVVSETLDAYQTNVDGERVLFARVKK